MVKTRLGNKCFFFSMYFFNVKPSQNGDDELHDVKGGTNIDIFRDLSSHVEKTCPL